MDNRYVLDSYAILALLNEEPGASRVETILEEARSVQTTALMSLINLGEVAYIIERRWGKDRLRILLAYLDASPVQVVDLNRRRVLAAAHVKASHSLAYADAFAAALATEFNAVLVTGDPEFESVEDQVQIEWLLR